MTYPHIVVAIHDSCDDALDITVVRDEKDKEEAVACLGRQGPVFVFPSPFIYWPDVHVEEGDPDRVLEAVVRNADD